MVSSKRWKALATVPIVHLGGPESFSDLSLDGIRPGSLAIASWEDMGLGGKLAACKEVYGITSSPIVLNTFPGQTAFNSTSCLIRADLKIDKRITSTYSKDNEER